MPVLCLHLQRLAPQIDTLKASKELEKLREAKRDLYRTRLSGAHDRVYEALSDVFLGFEMFMRPTLLCYTKEFICKLLSDLFVIAQ